MIFFTIIFGLLLLGSVFVVQESNAERCFPNAYPCILSRTTLDDLLDNKSMIIQHMDPVWVEEQKTLILHLFDNRVLDEWLLKDKSHLRVHWYHFLNGGVPWTNGEYVHEWWDSRIQQAKISPRKQLENGIDPKDIICKTEFLLVFKNDEKPSCVKIESIVKLYDRGWLLKYSRTLDYYQLGMEAARQAVMSGSTFSYDGINDSIKVQITSSRDSLPPMLGISGTFLTLHEGYGNRTEEKLEEEITNHTFEVSISQGIKVNSVIFDKKWDEVNQQWIGS